MLGRLKFSELKFLNIYFWFKWQNIYFWFKWQQEQCLPSILLSEYPAQLAQWTTNADQPYKVQPFKFSAVTWVWQHIQPGSGSIFNLWPPQTTKADQPYKLQPFPSDPWVWQHIQPEITPDQPLSQVSPTAISSHSATAGACTASATSRTYYLSVCVRSRLVTANQSVLSNQSVPAVYIWSAVESRLLPGQPVDQAMHSQSASSTVGLCYEPGQCWSLDTFAHPWWALANSAQWQCWARFVTTRWTVAMMWSYPW